MLFAWFRFSGVPTHFYLHIFPIFFSSLCHPGHSEQHQNKSHVKAVSSIKEENEDLTSPDSEIASSNSKPMLTDRSKSVPVSLGSQNLSTSLAPALSIDPLTGVCLAPSHSES